MTFRERQEALMADLVSERRQEVDGSWWALRLDGKIAELKTAMEGTV